MADSSLDGIISVATIAELYAGDKVRSEHEDIIHALLAPFDVVVIDPEISAEAGRLPRQWRQSHGLGLIDALIAATGLSQGVPVVTLNAKHFHFIPGFVVINPLAQ